jgi:signal transduction histidine kinase
LVHLVLSYPSGRVRGRIARAVVAAAYVDSLVEPLARNDALTLVLAGAVAFAACEMWLASSGPARRARTPALCSAVALAAALGIAATGRLETLGQRETVLLMYDVTVASITVLLLVDLLRGRWSERAVRGLVVDLGATSDTTRLQAKLARALGDPSLQLGYRLAGTNGFVDDAGRALVLPGAGSGRTVTPLVKRGEQIGVLVHDDALLADPVLIDSVAAAAQLAVANAELHAEARAQAAELESSRRRIVEATDRQRRRLERDLREGPERLLERSRKRLADAATTAPDGEGEAISTLEAGLSQAQQELRAFAQGIRPTALSEGGLMPALAALAEHSPLPVEIRGKVARLPEPVEATLYFVCAESLANAVKHAQASGMTIELSVQAGSTVVVVSDDGIGGATTRAGTGLAGLVDRVEALGGRLDVESPPRAGTRITAAVRQQT